jgi:transcription antitermination factor NusG
MLSDWQALFLKPRTEKRVAECCRTLGLSCYLPLRRETKIYQRRRVTITKPLFPGYLFAAVTPDGKLPLLRTNHVLRFLAPTRPLRLLRDLAQIRRALRADPALRPVAALTRGRRVRIVSGPFQGMEGMVARLAGTMRVVIAVEMIGVGVSVNADTSQVEAI